MNRVLLLGLAALTSLACAGSNATPPDDAVSDHERAAERADRAADGYRSAEAQAAGFHASQQDYPSAIDNRRAAIEQRERAAEHRALAQGLRAAEMQACAAVPEEQADPLLRREDITLVSIIEERGVSVTGPGDSLQTVGVRLKLRAAPGTTTESLQQLLACQIARARVSGTRTELGDASPLTLEDVVAKVGWMEDGFAVTVTSDDSNTVQEIVAWAQGLARPE